MSDEHQEKDFSFMLAQQFVLSLIVKFIVLHSIDSLFLSLTLYVVWEQVDYHSASCAYSRAQHAISPTRLKNEQRQKSQILLGSFCLLYLQSFHP